MKTIWKYILQPETTVQMPREARILCVQEQHGNTCLWALVDPQQPRETRRFNTYGTGFDMPENPGQYIGTFQVESGRLVFHVFEEILP